MSLKEVVLFFTLLTRFYCNGEFVIPEVTLEAYDPKGFRASIPGKAKLIHVFVVY